MSAINPTWWHKPAQRLDPLQALGMVADHLEHAPAAPQPAGRMVAAALRQYLAGQSFTDALGLRTAHGKRRATTQARDRARNDKLREAFERMGGLPSERAAKLAEMLHGTGKRPPAGLADIVAELRRDHAKLPRSGRHILRIVRDN